jgi:hypothetical protein
MPYSQAAINLKKQLSGREQRILERALIYPAPFPGKDHALGRRRDGTAFHSLVAADRPQANHGNCEVISDREKREAAILCRLRHPADHGAG